MSSDIRQLTPLGQMLVGKMRLHKSTHRKVCKSLRIAFNTWERCLTGRLDTITPSVKNKLRRWLGVDYLPEAPEDLSLMHNLVAAHDENYPWRPPYKSLEQVKEFRGTLHMRHYLLAYANRLTEYVYNTNDDVMSIEVSTRFTRYGAACSVNIDIFALQKPLTKIRWVLSLTGSMERIEHKLCEYSQKSNSELQCFSAGVLTEEAVKDTLTSIIPAFCFKSRPDPELTALEIALRHKEQINNVSHIRNADPAGAGSGESTTSDGVHPASEGEVSLPIKKRRSYRKRGFKKGRGGRK